MKVNFLVNRRCTKYTPGRPTWRPGPCKHACGLCGVLVDRRQCEIDLHHPGEQVDRIVSNHQFAGDTQFPTTRPSMDRRNGASTQSYTVRNPPCRAPRDGSDAVAPPRSLQHPPVINRPPSACARRYKQRLDRQPDIVRITPDRVIPGSPPAPTESLTDTLRFGAPHDPPASRPICPLPGEPRSSTSKPMQIAGYPDTATLAHAAAAAKQLPSPWRHHQPWLLPCHHYRSRFI